MGFRIRATVQIFNKHVKVVRKLTKSISKDSIQTEGTVLMGIGRRLVWLERSV